MSASEGSIPSEETPNTLVENRRAFGGEDMEFSIYDTYQPAKRVALRSPYPMFCGMVTGKKVMHVGSEEPFEFLPGESLVVPPLEDVHIDFPEADPDQPTTCVTLEIDRQKVDTLIDRLNETVPPAPASGPWDAEDLHHVHLENSAGVERTLQSLASLFTDADPDGYRDALIELNAAELVLRMLQTRSRALLIEDAEAHAPHHGLAAAVRHVHQNLDRHVTAEELAETACMSTSTFYRHFRNEFGMTPLQYVTTCRMERAQTLLRESDRTATEVCYDVGFNSLSHFISKFKEHVGMTPSRYQSEPTDESRPVAQEAIGQTGMLTGPT